MGFLNLKEPRTKKFLLLQGIALIVLVVAGLFFGNAMSSNPKTCTLCHEMSDPIKQWKASSHEKILCVKCHHKEEGVYGFILGLPKKMTEGWKHVTGNYSIPVKAQHNTESKVCQRCHVSWRNVSPSGDLIIPHNKHFEERKIECTKCHFSVVHGANIEGKFIRRPAMQVCLSCHETGKEDAPILKCKDCHTDKAVPPSHQEETWFANHSKVATDPSHIDSDCKKCHGWTPYFCSNCHRNHRPTTHYGGTAWRTYHSERARVNKSGCLVCHDAESFCYRCHDPFEDLKK